MAGEEKLLPQNLEAEMGMLACILMDSNGIGRVLPHARPEDCYREGHREIYAAMLALYERGEPVDLVTVPDELERRGKLELVGGASYVSLLTNQVPTSANAEHYAKIVRRCARNRRLITYGGQVAAIGYQDGDADASEQFAWDHLAEITRQAGGVEGFVGFGQVLDEVLEDILKRMDSAEGVGIRTGIAALDKHIMSIEPGELALLCGRPGSGKSTVGASIAYNVACEYERRSCESGQHAGSVAWVTLEMSRVQQAKRLIAAVAGIRVRVLRAGFRDTEGNIYRGKYEQMMQTWSDLKRLDPHLRVMHSGTTLPEIRALVAQEVRRHGCGLLVIDQLDLIESDNPKQTETERVARYSRDLKQLAMALRIPVLSLVQLNRETETQGTGNKPLLRNLASSDRLGRDSDFVIAAYRAAYYDKERAKREPMFAQHGELLVLKARDGDPGVSIPFRFEGEYTRVTDWPEGWPDLRDESKAQQQSEKGA